jgi:hypothetical protein
MILENTDDVRTQIYFLECLDEVMLNTLLQRVKNVCEMSLGARSGKIESSRRLEIQYP